MAQSTISPLIRSPKAMSIRIFVIDNYDSFTFNLVHLLEQLNVPICVKRNDEFELDELDSYSHLLISPGPGLPVEAGKTMEVISKFKNQKSILGVCLGMQALLVDANAEMMNLDCVQHGAESLISVEQKSMLFENLPQKIKVGRYHSWGFQSLQIPTDFEITALSNDGVVMAVEHKNLPLCGVQFHPESIMTEFGLEMLKNWIS